MGITYIVARFVLAFVMGGILGAGTVTIKAAGTAAAIMSVSGTAILASVLLSAFMFTFGYGNPIDLFAQIDLDTWLIITATAGFDVGALLTLWLIVQYD